MIWQKSAKKRRIIGKYETGISHSRSDDAALSRSDAIRVFPVGKVLGDAGVWRNGVSLLSGA